jgi:hypothetical protein
MRTGAWPKRLHDVEEMETLIRERKREEDARMAAQQGGTAEGEAT